MPTTNRQSGDKTVLALSEVMLKNLLLSGLTLRANVIWSTFSRISRFTRLLILKKAWGSKCQREMHMAQKCVTLFFFLLSSLLPVINTSLQPHVCVMFLSYFSQDSTGPGMPVSDTDMRHEEIRDDPRRTSIQPQNRTLVAYLTQMNSRNSMLLAYITIWHSAPQLGIHQLVTLLLWLRLHV